MAIYEVRQEVELRRSPQDPPATATQRRRGERGNGAARQAVGHEHMEPGERLARALGWLSLGIGLAEVAAPRAVARAIGMSAPDAHGFAHGFGLRDNRLAARLFGHSSRPLAEHVTEDPAATLRLFGLREIGTGLGIFAGERPSSGWLWARVAGDLLDLAFLGWSAPHAERKRLLAATAAVAGVTALDVVSASRLGGRRRASRLTEADGSIRVVESTTINRSPAECYAFWRDFRNLPRFLRHLDDVQMIDERRSRWRAKAPAGTQVEWEAQITADSPGELIVWQSCEGADVENDGSVRFLSGPKGLGTLVRVSVRYRPPAGALGAAVAKLFGEEPELQIRDDLRRFKQVMETGEVITTEGQPHGPTRASLVRLVSRS